MKALCNRQAVTEVLPAFLSILEKQFIGCGDKYAFTDNAEWTDVLVASDPHWIQRTIEKYVGRYKQYGAGRDLVKIATYAFIAAIKFGLVDGLDPLVQSEIDEGSFFCTTVPMKAEFWPSFRERVEQVADCLITQRRVYRIPEPMSGFDVTRTLVPDLMLGQIVVKTMEFEYLLDPHRRAFNLATIAFLCFVQWCQDGHHLAEVIDDDDPRETKGQKDDVENLGGSE